MDKLLSIIVEILSFAWYVGASILNVLFPLQDSKKDNTKKAIVFVHGLGGQPLAYAFLKSFLEKNGFAVYFVRINLFKSLGLGVNSIDELAKEIQTFVETLKLKNITLVGCSAGAVASLLFLEKYDGWKVVKKFIALSPAYRGGWIASLLNLFSPVSREFGSLKGILEQISKQKLKYPEKIVNLYGQWDEFVAPRSSKLEGVTEVQLTESGHAYLQTFSPTVAKLLVEYSK